MDIEKLVNQVIKAFNNRQSCINKLKVATGQKNALLRQKLKVLDEKYWLLQEKLTYYQSNLINSDDEIEIKRFGDEIRNKYGIYLKNEGIKIGHIDYEGYHASIIFGDIGYVIDYRFNGHHYAYKALCLLSSYLYDQGINDFYISAFNDNIPSIKTIMRYGGNIIRKEGRIVTFQCETRKKEKIKSS